VPALAQQDPMWTVWPSWADPRAAAATTTDAQPSTGPAAGAPPLDAQRVKSTIAARTLSA
jgi:hypothetical protein